MLHHHVEPRTGESAPFHLESLWHVPGASQRAWGMVSDIAAWPGWWHGVEDAAVESTGDGTGAGTRTRLRIRSPLVGDLELSLVVAHASPPSFALVVVDGDLRGHGLWRARETAGETRIDIVWCVVTRRRALRLLRALGPRAHRRVMRRGGLGLARALREPAPSRNRARLRQPDATTGAATSMR